MGLIKKHYLLIVLCIMIVFPRFALVGKGAFSFPDESRYHQSRAALSSLFNNDVTGFCKCIMNTQGRPGDTLLRLIPMAVQLLLYKWDGIPVENPESLKISIIFNVIISLLISIVFYNISLQLFENNRAIAFISTLTYSLLSNNNIYIRHILPYDEALLCFLVVLYLLLKWRSENLKYIAKFIIIGFLTGFGFAIYPGYYFFPILIFTFIVFTGTEKVLSKTKAIKVFSFAISSLSVLLLYEVLARFGDSSYVLSLLNLSETITEGSFEEGFSFLPKYLIGVEKYAGVFILLCTLFFTATVIYRVFRYGLPIKYNNHLNLLCVSMLGGFLLHASATTIFHKMVFYGRLVHIYFPFLIFATIAFLLEIKNVKLKNIIGGLFVALSVLSFIEFFKDYVSLAYPRDVLYKHRILTEHIDLAHKVCETNCSYPSFPISSPPPLSIKTNAPYNDETNFILVNFCFFNIISGWSGEDFSTFRPSQNHKLIYKAKHFLAFDPYTFEGYGIKERKMLKKRNYNVAIYKIE